MTHILIANNIKRLFKDYQKKYSHIYFGHEFCPKLLPNKKEMNDMINFAKKHQLNFSFLTPYADNAGIEKIKDIINHLQKRKSLNEVIVNDLGVLGFITSKYPECKIVLGRALTRINLLQKKSYVYKLGIRRTEYDCEKEIIKVDSIKISYYYPYMIIFSSRYCPSAKTDSKNINQINPGIINCKKECQHNGELIIKSVQTDKELILKGNTIFYKKKEETLPDYADRLVCQPYP